MSSDCGNEFRQLRRDGGSVPWGWRTTNAAIPRARGVVCAPYTTRIRYTDYCDGACRRGAGRAGGRSQRRSSTASRLIRTLTDSLSSAGVAGAAQWGIDLGKLSLTDGKNLWETITKELWRTRNAFVHAAEPVQKATAERGLECLDLLQEGLVKPLAARFRLTWPRTSWTGGSYPPRSPFGI